MKTKNLVETKATLRLLFVATVFVMSLIFHIWMRTQVTQLAYGVAEAKVQLSQVEAESMRWQAQKAETMNAWSLDQLVNKWESQGIFFKPIHSKQVIYIDHE